MAGSRCLPCHHLPLPSSSPTRAPTRLRPVALLFSIAIGLLLGSPAAADLDAVFVLDTTGSMSGEIREVQDRLGELADALTAAREGERIRYGVVAYRDRGDDYVTKVAPLAPDLASTAAFLDSLAAGGGGDGPESVVAALAVAIREMEWDAARGTDRQIFLVGDAPPHLDYADEPSPEELVREARADRIVINSIGCRSLPSTGVRFFREIAYATEGTYQHIGRIRRPEAGALAAALDEAATAGAAPAVDTGREIPVTWLDHGPGDSPGILVRRAGPEGIEQNPAGGALPACALEIRLPAGLALGTDPVVRSTHRGLRVGLELVEGDGGRDLFALGSCPPLSTPVHVDLGGA